MKRKVIQIRVDHVNYREDLYPRLKPDISTVRRYAESDLSRFPPIEVNQDGILIDGQHRLLAHRTAKRETISAIITRTKDERELLALAIERNAKHGLQLTDADRKKVAIELFSGGKGLTKKHIAATLSVTERTVNNYLSDIDKHLRRERREYICSRWLACATLEEIAQSAGVDKATVSREIELCCKLESFPSGNKIMANFSETRADSDGRVLPAFVQPLYNVWRLAKRSDNNIIHFGDCEQSLIENLLYLYTEPFEITLDPFSGGGATIDACKRRLRRYWVSDRKPIPERIGEIRKLDIVKDLPPLNKRWSEVSLTFLDPPYWRQAAGKYSSDPEDLANMSLRKFTSSIASVINRIGAKQTKGVIALLIQPTQWLSDDKRVVDHVCDIISAVGSTHVTLENRISCPYQAEQYTPAQVEWARVNKQLLVLTRELVVWRCGKLHKGKPVQR
jgi:DNA-binding CsgD family transcriptional regulator